MLKGEPSVRENGADFAAYPVAADEYHLCFWYENDDHLQHADFVIGHLPYWLLLCFSHISGSPQCFLRRRP